MKGAGILHLSEKCIVKGDDFSIYGHQPSSRNTLHITSDSVLPEIPSINHILNLSFPNITTDSSESKDINSSLNHIKSQIDIMKENAASAEFDISGHDIHQYVISYGLLAAAAVLGGIIWWRRRRRVRVVFPASTPTTATQQSDSDISEVSVSVNKHKNVKMIDIATSPITTKKCVRFCNYHEETV